LGIRPATLSDRSDG